MVWQNAGPQWRDQHAAREREPDEGPRGSDAQQLHQGLEHTLPGRRTQPV